MDASTITNSSPTVLNADTNSTSVILHRQVSSRSRRDRRRRLDKLARNLFRVAGLLAASMIILIILFLTLRGIRPFLPGYEEGARQQVLPFLTGDRWRADQGIYGVGFILINTLITSLGAGLLALPFAIFTAIIIGRMSSPRVSRFLTTIVETLAAIPSVVYGVFAAGQITGLVSDLAGVFGISTYGGNSQLAVLLLLALMIYPTMASLAISGIKAVPHTLDHASLALGATRNETYFKVVLPAARSSLVAGFALGLGRAFGEATAVSMVAGNAFTGPTWSPFDITRTLTSTMLSGLHETVGLDYDIRFSVAILLLLLILLTNALVFGVKHHFESRQGGRA